MGERWSASESRRVRKRIFVRCDLTLISPAHIGNGDDSDLTDMPLLVDDSGGTPVAFIPGTGIAGALRAYLRSLGVDGDLLFGAEKDSPNPHQGRLIVDEAFCKPGTDEIERWTSNRIAPRTGVAGEGKLFDIEMWAPGTTFEFECELLICDNDPEDELLRDLGHALAGFDMGRISLGKFKSDGFGDIKAALWRKCEFELRREYLDYLLQTKGFTGVADVSQIGGCKETHRASEQAGADFAGSRKSFEFSGRFAIVDSLLIGGGESANLVEPDIVHRRSRRADWQTTQSEQDGPVMSGSTFRKCLKAQARLIAGVHCSAPCVVEKFLEGLFGSTGHASRVKATFAPIKGGRADLAAAGIQLDRLLQKPMPGALYWKQPVYSDVLNEATRATFEIRLSGELSEAQVGLLMLALKDAWTQRIAFGKRAAGGRLQGLEATISYGGKQALLISEPQVSRYRSPALRVQGDADLLSILEEAINKLKAELKQQEIDALREERAPAGAP